MTVSQGHRPDTCHTKGSLFCQRCDHRSPIDGDWERDDATPGLRLRCPQCDCLVIDQPRICGSFVAEE